MDDDKVDKVRQFTSVTSADVSTAQFYLESHAWDVDGAIGAFFETGPTVGETTTRASATPVRVHRPRVVNSVLS